MVGRPCFDGQVTDLLGAHIREQWATLLDQGFTIASDDSSRVVLDSGEVQIVCTASPRGEVEVTVAPLGSHWPRQWAWAGMVGRAELARVLELALEQLRKDPAVIGGDTAFYDDLAATNAETSSAYTRWAEGKGPHPNTRRLP